MTGGSNILIVDDNPNNLQVLSSILMDQGYLVRPALSGEIALRAIASEVPDLIILDIRMPGISGYETCQRLKSNELTRDIPVMFISALNDIEDKMMAFLSGGVDFVTKPFQVEEVVVRVRTHLQTRQLQRRLEHQNEHLQTMVDEKVAQLIEAHLESRKRLEEIAHLNRNISSSVYSAAIAHDLRQPLAAILSNAEAAELYLEQEPPALDIVKEILADIRRDDHRASQIILRMRSLMNKSESDVREYDLNGIVQEVNRILVSEAKIHNVRISLDLATDPLPVMGDLVQLQQILINLVLNSMEAMADMPPFGRTVHIKTQNSDGTHAELTVIDSGIGFKDNIGRVFESFFTTKPQGMGMGLSIIASLIHMHNGQIWAENGEHGGAVMHVRLPMLDVPPISYKENLKKDEK